MECFSAWIHFSAFFLSVAKKPVRRNCADLLISSVFLFFGRKKCAPKSCCFFVEWQFLPLNQERRMMPLLRFCAGFLLENAAKPGAANDAAASLLCVVVLLITFAVICFCVATE